MPGGKVEEGESPHGALIREIQEELAVTIVLGEEIEAPAGTVWPLGKGLIMRVWLASCEGGTPVPTGSHDDLRWLSPGDWPSVPWLDGDRPILQWLMDGGRFTGSERTSRPLA